MPDCRAGRITVMLAVMMASAFLYEANCFAQAACSAASPREATAAEQAYKDGKYETADSLLVQALEAKPSDASLTAALIHTLLHEGRVDDAAGRVTKALIDNPRSPELLAAMAEVQLRQGHPWLAAQSLDRAAAADPCSARAHLIRSRIYRLDSMYASERSELKIAYQLDPSDPDIWHTWLQIIRPANEVESISESLRTTPNLDAEVRDKAMASANAMRQLLTENSQTCQSAELSAPITLPLIASHLSVKEVSAYKLRVDMPKSSARLILDTAASGLYISRSTADANGFQHDDADPPGTVRAASLHVGPLELRNCLVGVSEGPFGDGGDGFIGTDVFASDMITLNFPEGALELAPLPKPAGDLPGDRSTTLEREGFTPVLHRKQFLLLPVTLNKKERQLFVLDTGVRLTTLTAAAAHALSNTRVNFTNTVKTVSGGSLQVYRDTFDFQFANMDVDDQKRVIAFDASALNENAGIEVAGLLGFNILQSLVIQMDYRDGLVKFTSPASSPARMNLAANTGAAVPAQSTEQTYACDQYKDQNADRSVDSMLEGLVVGGLDSARLKPGQTVSLRVMRDWISPVCILRSRSNLYGHVLSSTSSKTAGASTLAIVFDHGDCEGRARQELLLRLIGVAGGDARSEALHNDLPTEVSGGSRQIRSAAINQGNLDDNSAAPELAPALIHPGSVSGLPHLKLTPEGGPQCSALLTSQERSVHLASGTELIMTVQQASTP